jgi:hypothetical protein
MKGTAMGCELKCEISVFVGEVRYALPFDIADCIVGLRHPRFATTYFIHFQVSKIQAASNLFDSLIHDYRIDLLSRKVGKKLLLYSKQHPSIAQILFKVV